MTDAEHRIWKARSNDRQQESLWFGCDCIHRLSATGNHILGHSGLKSTQILTILELHVAYALPKYSPIATR